jgi:IclR family transcriptional regulator, acetate operon repressor
MTQSTRRTDSSAPLGPARTPARRGRTPTSAAPTAQVQSLTRGLTILERLSEVEGGMSLTDIAARVGLPASTTHRLLATLEQMGYVVQSGDLGLWYVGLKAFRVGSAFISNRDFVGESHAYMRRLMEQSGETANLAIMDGREVVFIAQVQCHEVMRMSVRLGSRLHVHASGSGKAILAALPMSELNRFLDEKPLSALTPHTLTDVKRLHEDLALIRRRGYSYDDEEVAVGLRCVAAAIYDEFAEPLGAISLAGPAARIGDSSLDRLGGLVRATAKEITGRLGGRWPHHE